MVLKFVVLVAFVFAEMGSAVKIPPELKLKKCTLKDSNDKLDECLRAALEDAIFKLKDGSPPLGVPRLDPVEVTEIALETDQSTPIRMNIKLKNIQISRVARAKLTQLHVDQTNKKRIIISANATNDKLVMKGNYQSLGRLLAIPITSDGPMKIELTDVKTEVRMEFEPVVRKGVKYWDLIKMDYDVFDVANEKMKLDNLIKGNRALDENLNQVLNENWRELDRQMRPAFTKALKLYFTGVTERFFRRVPIKEIIDGSE